MTESKRVVLFGATGMIGRHCLEFCLEHGDVSAVTAIGRRPTGVEHAKLREVLHRDFADCDSLVEELRDQDLALYCIGAYTGSVPDEELRRVTVDLVVEPARVLHEASPDAAFCLLSGQGADRSETSRISFARYKGMAENSLVRMGFPRVHLLRPGYIYPVEPRREPNLSYRIFRALYPLVRRIYPNIGVSSVDLARAMVAVGLDGSLAGEDAVIENREIRDIAGRAAAALSESTET